MIEVKNVSKAIATQAGLLPILRGVDFSIKRGETVAILGTSGSGKTTLLGILAGLDLPTEGEVVIDGENWSALGEEARAALRAEKVGFVFQSFQLIPSFTALENTVLPLELSSNAPAGMLQQKAIKLLAKVGLQHRLHHLPRQLSGGEQQRVAIARAFVCRPAILFADEPTGNLDKKTGKMVMDLLFELNETEGSTLILVTHDEALAARCQRRLLLDEGSMGVPDEPAREHTS